MGAPDGNLGGPLAEQAADLLKEGYFVRKLTGEIGIHVPGLKNSIRQPAVCIP